MARVRAARPVRSVLLVCQGNINRSAYASAALTQLTDGRVHVSSAGFIGPGRRVPHLSEEVAGRRGVDLSTHRSRLVTRPLVTQADLVVVTDPLQRVPVRGLGGQLTGLLGNFDPSQSRRQWCVTRGAAGGSGRARLSTDRPVPRVAGTSDDGRRGCALNGRDRFSEVPRRQDRLGRRGRYGGVPTCCRPPSHLMGTGRAPRCPRESAPR